jgi:hypothetical protein
LASVLERAGGKFVELRYKEYLNPIPWRGASEYVVTEIIRVENTKNNENFPIK